LDIYGKTKSLGEVKAKNFYNIRTSMIGPEKKSKVSIFEWFLSQKKNAVIKGYTNHYWNGITTLHFAKLCYAIILRFENVKKNRVIPNNLHFVPKDIVSKYALLKIISKQFKRDDIRITKTKAGDNIDRSLSTIHQKTVNGLWKDMGYNRPLTVELMVEELSEYVKKRNFHATQKTNRR